MVNIVSLPIRLQHLKPFKLAIERGGVVDVALPEGVLNLAPDAHDLGP